MDPKELLALLVACKGQMEEYLSKCTSATEEEDKKKWRLLFEAKQTEFGELQGKLADARKLADAQKAIDSAKALTEPDDSHINLAQGKTQESQKEDKAKARGAGVYDTLIDLNRAKSRHHIEVDSDPVRDLRLRKGFFLDWVGYGAKVLDGLQFDAIKSKCPRVEKVAGTEAVVLPEDMTALIRAQMMGKSGVLIDPYSGKTILSTDATGGATDSGAANLLAPDFRPQLLEYQVSAPTLYDRCTVIPAANGSAEWPMLDQGQGNYGGVAFTWKATEGADKGETEPTFKDFTISTNELSGWTEASLAALRRSAIDLEGHLMRLFRLACKYEWSRVVLNGDGTNKPEGIIQATGVTEVARGTVNQVDWDDLTNLEYAIPQAQRVGATFSISDAVEKYLKQTVDGDSRPLFTADVHSQIKNMLAGYGYTAHEYDAATIGVLGTAGEVMFGAWQNYVFALEEDISIARSEHAEFKAGKVVFRLICFVGGKAMYPAFFAKLKATTT